MTKNHISHMSVVDMALAMEHNVLEIAKREYMAKNVNKFEEVIKNSKIIINGITTVMITPEGDKVICRPSSGEEYDKETGIAMCIVKYLFGSRRKFLQFADKAIDQTPDRGATV